ncbi:MAG: hypothetical protein LBR86_06910 [Tannerella sp.]|jgi:hypothetical protein|nr:hypothetical protein [Tannerella sp.]
MAKDKRARKKKYVNVAEQQKQQEIQYKKFFFDKLQNLCGQIGDVSLYSLIPLVEKILIYRFRGAPLKIRVAPGAKIQKMLMNALEKTIRSQQLVMKLEVVKESGQMMTFADYSTVGMAFEHHLTASDTNYPGKERFAGFAELREERERLYEEGILNICSMACWVFDDIGRKYLHTYSFETCMPAVDSGVRAPQGVSFNNREWKVFSEQDFRLHPVITIGTCPLEVRKVKIHGELHTAIQIGSVRYEDDVPKLNPFILSPDDLHLSTSFSKTALPVYIQQHALDRMKERLVTTMPCFYRHILLDAFIRKEFIPISRKRLLITCFIENLKTGYFVAEKVDGILLVRTFLLLTNGGTPEGDRLAKLTGLETDDRKYLAIDTLQGLANSDIEQNETVCMLFHKAGCGSILELCKKINSDPAKMWLLDTSHPKNIIADLMTEYMKPNADNEEYVS